MGIVYSVNGFPTNSTAPAAQPGAAEVRYHDANIDALYANGTPLTEVSFEDELATLEIILRAWAASGNMFANLLQPGVVVSPSVTSFLVETAQVVFGSKSRRVMSFQDWGLLLKPGADTKTAGVQLTEEDLQVISNAGKMAPEQLFQAWVLSAGFADLVSTMKLLIGDIDAV